MLGHSVHVRLGVPNYPVQQFNVGEHVITARATPLGKLRSTPFGKRLWFLTGGRVGISVRLESDSSPAPTLAYSLRYHGPDGLPNPYHGATQYEPVQLPFEPITSANLAYLAEPGNCRYDLTLVEEDFRHDAVRKAWDRIVTDDNTRTVADFHVLARDNVTMATALLVVGAFVGAVASLVIGSLW